MVLLTSLETVTLRVRHRNGRVVEVTLSRSHERNLNSRNEFDKTYARSALYQAYRDACHEQYPHAHPGHVKWEDLIIDGPDLMVIGVNAPPSLSRSS